MEKLSGKTALVTGSTDGVGRLVARKLGQAGARVLVHGRISEGRSDDLARASPLRRLPCAPMPRTPPKAPLTWHLRPAESAMG